jgi:predicted nucleotidyltransferase
MSAPLPRQAAPPVLVRARAALAARDRWLVEARAALPALVGLLVQDYGVRRVVLFGSILRGDPSDAPDIDLLVEGLDPARHDEALGRLLLAAPLPVDLVSVEHGRPTVVQRALLEGEVLYVA